MPKKPNSNPTEPENTAPNPAPEAPATGEPPKEPPASEETSGQNDTPPAEPPSTEEPPKSPEAAPAPAEAEAGAPSPDTPSDMVMIPRERIEAAKRKLREASEARDMWDARARAKEAYELLGD